MSAKTHTLGQAALLLSVLAMGACAASPEEEDGARESASRDNTPLALDGSAWTLSSASGGTFGKGVERGIVTLAFGPERVSGSGGCNRYQADYTLDGNALVLGPVGATKRGCVDGRGEIERAWFAVLSGPLTLSRSGDELVLRAADGASYTLVASDEKPGDADGG